MSRSTRARRREGEAAAGPAGRKRGASFEEMLSAALTGDLARFCDRLVASDDGRASVAAEKLLRPDAFDRIVEPFAARYPDTDRRAVVSFWSQWYFSALIVPSVATNLLLDRRLPLAIDELALIVDGDEHRPAGFRLPGAGPPLDPDAGPFERFRPLVRGHLAPLVEMIAGHVGLAPRLLWSNAGSYFDWIVGRLEAGEDGERVAAPGRQLLRTRTWPDGRENPLFEPVRVVEGEDGEVRQRKICCLRYLLPGVEGCGVLCPLPE